MIKPPFPDQVFESVDEWIALAYRRLRAHPNYNNTEHGELKGYRGEHFAAMCFDAAGRRCQRGADFHRARDENAFPVWWVWPDQIPELVRRAEMATVFNDGRFTREG